MIRIFFLLCLLTTMYDTRSMNELLEPIKTNNYISFLSFLEKVEDRSLLKEALAEAVVADRENFVEAILEKDGSLINEKITPNGATAFMLSTGSENMFTFLLTLKNLNVRDVDKRGWNALMYATQENNLSAVSSLLPKMSYEDINQQSSESYTLNNFYKYPKGSTALTIALINMKNDIANTLLKYLQDHKDYKAETSINLTDENGWNALMVAIAEDADPEIIKKLTNQTALSQQAIKVYKTIPQGSTAFMIALINNRNRIVDNFIAKSLNFEQVDSHGQNALMIAIRYYNNIDVIKKIITSKKINLNATDQEGSTALMLAIVNYKDDIVNFLIQKDVTFDIQNKAGWSALMLAAYRGADLIVRKLLLNDIFLCYKGTVTKELDLFPGIEVGSNALMIALQKGHLDTASLILPDCMNDVSSAHYSPLILALLAVGSDSGFKELALKMIEKVDINHQVISGLSPLMIACVTGQEDVVNLLLNKGADVDAVLKETIHFKPYNSLFVYDQAPWSKLVTLDKIQKGSTALDIALLMKKNTDDDVYDAIRQLLLSKSKKRVFVREQADLLESLSTLQQTLMRLKSTL